MIKNYFFLRPIIEAHHKQFSNASILSVFTQNKNEIVWETSSGFLLIHIDKKLPYIIYRDEVYRRHQSMEIANLLVGETIASISFINNKRIIKIVTTKYTVFLNLYFRDVGLSVHTQEGNECLKFKSSVTDIYEEDLNDQHLYNLLHHEIAYRNCTEELFLNELKTAADFFLYRTDKAIHLSHVELRHLEIEPEVFWQEKVYEGYNRYIFSMMAEKRFIHLKQSIVSALEKQHHIYSKSLENITDARENQTKKETYENYGHYIMANLHTIKRGDHFLITSDWVSGEEIKVSLNPEYTAHENAEVYYRKAKGFEQNQTQLTARKVHAEQKLELIASLTKKIAEAKRVKDMEKLRKICLAEKWISPESNKEKRTMQHTSYNYYEFEIDGHDVFVGKDAKSNDFLSLKLSKANDYWFHVQGSPGSHVILKWHGYKEEPQKELLKKVASLTAYYSKQKNAGTIPVIYTQSKYVKKPKGAKPGAVVVQKEKSIFVQPKPIEELK